MSVLLVVRGRSPQAAPPLPWGKLPHYQGTYGREELLVHDDKGFILLYSPPSLLLFLPPSYIYIFYIFPIFIFRKIYLVC